MNRVMRGIERVTFALQISTILCGVALALVLTGCAERTRGVTTDPYTEIMRGRESTYGTRGSIQRYDPAPVPVQDPACYAMSQDAIYYRFYCR